MSGAFAAEATKLVRALPDASELASDEDRRRAHGLCERLAELCEHYGGRLPPSAAAPLLLDLAKDLGARRHWAASRACCERVLRACEEVEEAAATGDDGVGPSSATRLWRAEAQVHTAAARSELALLDDRALLLPATRAALFAALAVRHCCRAADSEDHALRSAAKASPMRIPRRRTRGSHSIRRRRVTRTAVPPTPRSPRLRRCRCAWCTP